MSLTQEQRQKVEAALAGLVKNAFTKLRSASLAARPVDPFLVLVARSPRDLAEFIVWQRLERGVVTSLGFRLERVARTVGTVLRSSGVAEADLEGTDEVLRRRYLMKVKSGPDTVNKTMAKGIASSLQEAENRMNRDGDLAGWVVVKMLGMCYGQPKHRSRWVTDLGKRSV